jgi:phage gp37-like protein
MIRGAMFESLSDLFGHQEWADAVHWGAFESHPGALDDDGLRRRLDNIQAVQRAFLTVWKDAPKWPEPFESYTTALAIRDYAHA